MRRRIADVCKLFNMRIIKIFAGLFCLVGLPVVLATALNGFEHAPWLAVVAIVSAVCGVLVFCGSDGFIHSPKFIGNLDVDYPQINQTYAMLFVALIINLLIANLCG